MLQVHVQLVFNLQLYQGWIYYVIGPCLVSFQLLAIHGVDILCYRSMFSYFSSCSYTWGGYIMLQVHVQLVFNLQLQVHVQLLFKLQLYIGWIYYVIGPCLVSFQPLAILGVDILCDRSMFSQFSTFSYTWGGYTMLQVHVQLLFKLQLYMGWIYYVIGPCLVSFQPSAIYGVDILCDRSMFSQFSTFSYTWGGYTMLQVHVKLVFVTLLAI